MRTSIGRKTLLYTFCVVFWAMAVCLHGNLAAGAEPAKADSQTPAPTTQTQPSDEPVKAATLAAPPELIQAFVKAAKESKEYKTLSGLTEEAVRKAAPDCKVLYPINLIWCFSSPELEIDLPDGQKCWLDISDKKNSVFLNVRRGDKRTQYVASRQDMKELDAIEVPSSITLVDPANKPIERFAADGESIRAVASKICKLGDMDLVMPSAPGDAAAAITLDLRNKSALECLEYAVRAAGLEITVEGQPNALLDLDFKSIASRSGTTAEALEIIKQEAARVAKIVATHRPVVLITKPQPKGGS